MSDLISEIQEKFGVTADQAKGAVDTAMSWVKDRLPDDTSDKVKELIDATGSAAGDVWEKAKDAGSDVVGKTEELGGSAAKGAGEVWGKTKGVAADALEKSKDVGGDAAAKTKEIGDAVAGGASEVWGKAKGVVDKSD
jgi:hypothetical protein